MEWLKNAAKDVSSVLGVFGSTLKELADSKRAILAGTVIIVNAAVQLFPAATAQLAGVVPTLDIVLGALALLYTIKDTKPTAG